MFRKIASLACFATLLPVSISEAQLADGVDRASAASPTSVGSPRRPRSPVGRAPGPPGASERLVTLDQLLAHAMKHAPDLVVGRADVAVGRAEIEAASPWLPSDPVVSGRVGRRWTEAGSGVDYAVGLSQELDVAGRRGLALRAARFGLSAREAELHATEWFVHQRVHAAYHQAIVARERVHAAERLLVFSERLLQIAEQRLAAGETSPLPARLAEGEVAQAKQAKMLAVSVYDRIRIELARIAGWHESELITPAASLGQPESPPDAASLIRRAERQEPALLAARARTEAARTRLAAAERRAWPNPTVGIDFVSESDPGSTPQRILSGSLSIPLPLFVGQKPEVSRARAAVERASAEKEAIGDTLAARVVEARQRAHVNAERARLFGSEILPTFERNLELLQKAFELGEIDILQVMVAQERFLHSQQEALKAFADYYESWAELESAVGAELQATKGTAGLGGEPQ